MEEEIANELHEGRQIAQQQAERLQQFDATDDGRGMSRRDYIGRLLSEALIEDGALISDRVLLAGYVSGWHSNGYRMQFRTLPEIDQARQRGRQEQQYTRSLFEQTEIGFGAAGDRPYWYRIELL